MERLFEIIANGTSMGTFSANNEDDAIFVYVRDAGYQSLEDMAQRLCRTEQGLWDEIKVKPITFHAYAFDQNGDVVASSESESEVRTLARLYRKLKDGFYKRTGFMHELENVDNATDETIDIYLGPTDLRGNFDIWTYEGAQYQGGVNVKQSPHCAAWQREQRRLVAA